MSKRRNSETTDPELVVDAAAVDLASAEAEVGGTPLHSPVVTGEAAGATVDAAAGNDGISNLGQVVATVVQNNANGPSAVHAPASLDVTAEGAGTLALSDDLTPGVAAIAADTGVDAEAIIAATKNLGTVAPLAVTKLNSSLVLRHNGAVGDAAPAVDDSGEAAPELDLGTVGDGSAITLAASAVDGSGDGEAAVDGSSDGEAAPAVDGSGDGEAAPAVDGSGDGEAALEAMAEAALDAIAEALGATVLAEDDAEGEGSGDEGDSDEDTSNVAAGNQDGADADVSLSGDVADGAGATA